MFSAPYYESPSSGSYALDVPLKAHGGTLTIGYGTGGASPFSYYLRYPQTIDVGFLKLFLSTKPIDLSNISQSTPFEDSRGSVDVSKNLGDIWGTILIPVIQRRDPPNTETHCIQCGSISAKSLDLQQRTVIHDLEYKAEMLEKDLNILRQTAADVKRAHEEEVSTLKSKLEAQEEENRKLIGLTDTKANKRQGELQLQRRESFGSNHVGERSTPTTSPSKKRSWLLRVKRLIHLHWI